jgi:hypothetical protein
VFPGIEADDRDYVATVLVSLKEKQEDMLKMKARDLRPLTHKDLEVGIARINRILATEGL